MTEHANSPPQGDSAPGAFVGRSAPMLRLYAMLRSAAGSPAPVFLSGEDGSGKSLAARTIHDLSDRAAMPFVTFDCGLPRAGRIEAELLGDASDGGTAGGLLAEAHGGTLFLKNICTLDSALQARLMHALDPADATGGRPRLIVSCADPQGDVAQGRFRRDLYYRLHVLPIPLPPLRDRGQDILLLAETILQQLSHEEGRSFAGLSDEVAAQFLAHDWPGNVRELANVLRGIAVLNDGAEVTMDMLPPALTPRGDAPPPPSRDAAVAALAGLPLALVERLVIEETIRQSGSITRAARLLDVAPSTIYRKIEGWAESS